MKLGRTGSSGALSALECPRPRADPFRPSGTGGRGRVHCTTIKRASMLFSGPESAAEPVNKPGRGARNRLSRRLLPSHDHDDVSGVPISRALGPNLNAYGGSLVALRAFRSTLWPRELLSAQRASPDTAGPLQVSGSPSDLERPRGAVPRPQ